MREWSGDNPYFLIISPDEGDGEIVDLDERGWLQKFGHLLRVPANWYLLRKDHESTGVVVLQLRVNEGDQPYYTARHVGIASAATGDKRAEITAYGVGAKRADHTDRLWVLPDGSVCAGDDVEFVSLAMIKRGAA